MGVRFSWDAFKRGPAPDSGDDVGIPWLNDASHTFTQKLGLPDPWQQLYGDPAKKQKAALQQAADQMHALAASERAQQMQGLSQAEAYFAPAQKTYQSIYGSPQTLTAARTGSIYGGK